MPAEITLERAFRDEPYKSMITLLANFKEGLSLKEFQYALVKDHKLLLSGHYIEKWGIPATKKDSAYGKFYNLIQSGKIKQYEPNLREGKTKPSVKIRNNIRNHLDRLKQKGWIYKDGMQYKLAIEVVADWQRHQNIDELKDYNIDQIQVFSLLPSKFIGEPSPFHPQLMIYGFHPDILDEEANEKIIEKLDKITDIFFELNALQTEKVKQYWQQKLQELKSTMKRRKIRQMINADKYGRIGYLFELFETLFKLESSDKKRFEALARIMLKAEDEQWGELAGKLGRWILKFKEYTLNDDEVKELCVFAWKNKEFFDKIANKNIAFSTYWGKCGF